MSRSFDRQINQKLYAFESEVPAHLWDGIASQLPKKKRRFGFLFWLLGAGLIGLGLFFFKKGAAPQNQLIPMIDHPPVLETKLALHPLAVDNKSNLMVDSSNMAKAQNATNLPSKKTSKIPVISSKIEPTKKGINASEAPAETKLSFIDKSTTFSSTPGDKTPPKRVLELLKRPYLKLHVIPQKSGLLLYGPANIVDPKIVACPPFSSQGLALAPFIEINTFGGLPTKFLGSKTEEHLSYKDLREKSETVKSSFTLQALVGLQIGEKVELKSGLGYTALFELFDYIDENASRTITNIVIDTIYDNNGNYIINADTSIVTVYGRHIKKTHNRYSFIDIPIMAGYVFNVKNHTFIIEAGASLNLRLGAKGNILSPAEEIMNLGRSAEPVSPILKKRAGWNFEGAIGYQVSLSETSALRIKAGLSYPISDISHPDYPISQKYRQWRFGLSWRHRL